MKINYFLFKEFDKTDEYLLTNELGSYFFLKKQYLKYLINEEFDYIPAEILCQLLEKNFIFDGNQELFLRKAKYDYREMKSYLFMATPLHIFVLTDQCNMACVYCQAQDKKQTKHGKMTKDVAKKAVDIALQTPNRSLDFEFQGGEPLINFSIIKYIVEYAEENKEDKVIRYSLVTNTLLMSDEMIQFFLKYDFAISTSLDGDKYVHDSNRKTVYGENTYYLVENNIRKISNSGLPIGAIQTTTKVSLGHPESIIETYLEMGLRRIFLRPLTPLGFAAENWDDIGYSEQDFLRFYEQALLYIIEKNKEGNKIQEGTAVFFLKKILGGYSENYMELRSPCGASVGQIAYYYDGNIYSCDEGRMMAEMGHNDFCLGNVNNNYDELMDSSVCRTVSTASVLESLPGCSDCVYMPFCGVCPVVNYALEGNILPARANFYRCKINKGILDLLFNLIRNNSDAREVFKAWI